MERNQQELLKNKNNSSEIDDEINFVFDSYFKFHKNNDNKERNSSFLEWFIGFTEGDGSFILSKGKIYFDITQNIDDIQVLYYIQKELGFGKVLSRKESHRRVGVFYVSSKENYLKLIHIFNGNLCSNYRNEQFKLWLNTFNKQYKEDVKYIDRKVIPSLNSAWLSGFIDAEGSFCGRIKYCRTSRLRKAPHLSLTISQKEYFILGLIRKLFVNDDRCISYDKSWNGWRLHIASFKVLITVINYLNIYSLKTKKKVAYSRFVELHNKIMKKEHLTLSGIEDLERLMSLINQNKI
jgi:LAGLIDADG endonuclease